MVYHLKGRAMKLEKVLTETLRKRVYDQLKRKIISAEILPGELLSFRDLARDSGVSIIPVREALWQLETEKIVVIESSKSIHVNKLTKGEMEEALRIRILLESMAAERACRIRPESAVREAKELLGEMQNAIENPQQYMEKNGQFHLAIYSHANSSILLQIINMLWARVGPYLSIFAQKGGDLSRAMKCHRGMYEAFAKKNVAKMREYLRKDLEEAAKFIIPYLEQSNHIKDD
jgi:DNA-binding GntR family transcriptional regulator